MGLIYRAGRVASRAAAVLLLPLAAAADAPALAPYTITDGARITHSLTGSPGEARAGARLYAESARAACRACHGMPGEGSGPAPDLAGVAGRLSEGRIRLWLVAPEALDPALAFHARYRAGQRRGAEDPLHGGPRLTAGEIENLVAWLATLTGPP